LTVDGWEDNLLICQLANMLIEKASVFLTMAPFTIHDKKILTWITD
jgi:hypothetical protein